VSFCIYVEAFIIIRHVISYWICSLYHVLTSTGTYVMFNSTSCHPPSDNPATNVYPWHLLHYIYLSFTRNSITVQWQMSLTAECECENVAQTVGTTILFKHIHYGDVKSASEKCWLHTTLEVVALRLSAHSWALHMKQKAQNIITVPSIG
jgi:hypothetical protein